MNVNSSTPSFGCRECCCSASIEDLTNTFRLTCPLLHVQALSANHLNENKCGRIEVLRLHEWNTTRMLMIVNIGEHSYSLRRCDFACRPFEWIAGISRMNKIVVHEISYCRMYYTDVHARVAWMHAPMVGKALKLANLTKVKKIAKVSPNSGRQVWPMVWQKHKTHFTKQTAD